MHIFTEALLSPKSRAHFNILKAWHISELLFLHFYDPCFILLGYSALDLWCLSRLAYMQKAEWNVLEHRQGWILYGFLWQYHLKREKVFYKLWWHLKRQGWNVFSSHFRHIIDHSWQVLKRFNHFSKSCQPIRVNIRERLQICVCVLYHDFFYHLFWFYASLYFVLFLTTTLAKCRILVFAWGL